MTPSCARCRLQGCREHPSTARYPANCPMESEAAARSREAYEDPDTLALALAAARTEAGGYCRDTRVEEVMALARRLGVDHLGIAFCVGLVREAGLLVDILEHHGFRVSSVCCKVGSIDKESVGLGPEDKLRPDSYEALCNPVGQAAVLAEAGTGLNVAVGLCVGHDTLFFQHSAAPVTVLVAKDRVLGHNPVAALYTSRSYYRRLRGE